MKNLLKITLVSALMGLFVGCESGELDLLENPNDINIESADPNFVLNSIQLSFNTIFQGEFVLGNFRDGVNSSSMQITRMINQFGQYNSIVDDNTLVNSWSNAYRMFANVDLIEQIDANDPDGIPYHVGVAQVLEAYTYMILVDYLGDVPFTEANRPIEFPTPGLDSGESIYAAQIALLDTAIGNLSADTNILPIDIYYNGEAFDANNWIALANTLKLRAALNTGDGAAISALSSQNIIDTVEEDFQFSYSNTLEPESRHPFFVNNYLATANTYLSNPYYDYLNAGDTNAPFVENGIADPRLRFYIYRQRDEEPSGSNLPCAGNAIYDYCYVGNKYWGRDHADDEGLPNDGPKKSTYGVYPAGGAFDKNDFVRARDVSESMEGVGITPIYLSSFTHFALAEAALTLGTGGNALALMTQGIQLSMDKVLDFNTLDTDGADGTDYEATNADVSDYIARVTAEYNGASAAGKEEIVAREWYLAAFGNGVEPYNTYRRTGYPTLQSPIIPAGEFPRIYRYPNTATTANPNIDQQPLTNQVFWDTNPAGFID
ncbi:hypothetical protein ULMA_28520 [Patiriisocius marinus]|uniref:Starch-binding associating with outer membrane n=1 Tax=Patiriisocius marinus TaxID=1397112 RepID=A0A5J4J093_9FLAO|nr:SusD/RagB family nutrient-binding outer membrane lipoprotein [Patiriisocius marinus]GER60744.1 hypothetical protein ULMA_28520 [Patiriisocius marinus]